jgi:signal transduction histidine kinase
VIRAGLGIYILDYGLVFLRALEMLSPIRSLFKLLDIRLALSSLRVRLMLLVLIVVLPVLGLTLYAHLEGRRLAVIEAQGNAMRMTRLAAGNLAQLTEGARQLLIALSWFGGTSDTDMAHCSARLADVLERYPLYVNVGVVAADGSLLCSGAPLDHRNLADHAWFQRAIQSRGFVVGEYRADHTLGEATFNFGYPVIDAADQVQAVVFASFDLTSMGYLADQIQLPRGAALIVIDLNGTILARYPEPEQWVGKSVPETAIVQAIFTRHEGTAEALGVDGVSRLYAFAPVGDAASGMYVSIGIPKTIAFAAADQALVRNLVGLAVATTLALAISWFLSDVFVLRHVRSLVRATQRLAGGDLSARAGKPDNGGELGQLARSFDEMATSLQQRTEQLEQANKELETFGYTVSHDLRTPLHIIYSYSEMLLGDYADTLDATGQECLQRTHSAARRMSDMIEGLLNLSRATHSELQCTTVDLSAMAKAIAADLQRAALYRSVEFVVADKIVVSGDEHLLGVVLANLIGNAWKYTGRQAQPRVEFGVTSGPHSEPIYFVSDNGVGFDMDKADRLFAPFQRLHSKAEFSGTGIGLATVQRIVQRHGGRVWAKSASGQGATFYFTLA